MHMSKPCRAAALCGLLIAPLSVALSVAQAGDFWMSNSLTFLHGRDYQVGEATRSIATFEHASGWSWGDQFLFVDQTWDDSGTDTYDEWSPRIKLWSPNRNGIRSVLLAATVERGANDVAAELLGVGVSFDAPGFSYLNVHLLARDTRHRDGHTWQTTITWSYPFTIGSSNWRLDGFTDIAGSEGIYRRNVLFVPQLKVDIGEMFGAGAGNLWAGIEYQYWSPKYGLPASVPIKRDESVAQLMLQWFF